LAVYRSVAGVVTGLVVHELAVLVGRTVSLVLLGVAIAHAADGIRIAAAVTLVLLRIRIPARSIPPRQARPIDEPEGVGRVSDQLCPRLRLGHAPERGTARPQAGAGAGGGRRACTRGPRCLPRAPVVPASNPLQLGLVSRKARPLSCRAGAWRAHRGSLHTRRREGGRAMRRSPTRLVRRRAPNTRRRLNMLCGSDSYFGSPNILFG